MADNKQPLLSSRDEVVPAPLPATANPSIISGSTFNPDSDDIPPITSVRDFFREFNRESKKLWFLAGPAVFTSICQYSLGAVTQIFAGQVGTLDLAAVSIENSVIAGFSFGLLLGMGSALETLCGQAFGAGQVDMLGIYMQRADGGDIESCGSVRSLYDPTAVRLRDELSDNQVPAVAEQDHGNGGDRGGGADHTHSVELAADVEARVGAGGRGGGAEPVVVDHSVGAAGSEVWYFMALILFAGYLKDAEVSVDGLSICMNILGWTVMVSLGMNAAISVRVSNELGGGHPRTAKFSLVVAVITSFFVGVFLSLILIIFRNKYPAMFSSDSEVQALVEQLTCTFAGNLHFGVPLGLLFGYYFDWGVEGIWSGMLIGTCIQTIVLFIMVYKTNWNKEASIAEDRIKRWGGQSDNPTT
ncbi:hypothetical protein ACLB2K_042571 [Fragaria x ananassa]